MSCHCLLGWWQHREKISWDSRKSYQDGEWKWKVEKQSSLWRYWQVSQVSYYDTDRWVRCLIMILTGESGVSLWYWQGSQLSRYDTDRWVLGLIMILTGESGVHYDTDWWVMCLIMILTGESGVHFDTDWWVMCLTILTGGSCVSWCWQVCHVS